MTVLHASSVYSDGKTYFIKFDTPELLEKFEDLRQAEGAKVAILIFTDRPGVEIEVVSNQPRLTVDDLIEELKANGITHIGDNYFRYNILVFQLQQRAMEIVISVVNQVKQFVVDTYTGHIPLDSTTIVANILGHVMGRPRVSEITIPDAVLQAIRNYHLYAQTNPSYGRLQQDFDVRIKPVLALLETNDLIINNRDEYSVTEKGVAYLVANT